MNRIVRRRLERQKAREEHRQKAAATKPAAKGKNPAPTKKRTRKGTS